MKRLVTILLVLVLVVTTISFLHSYASRKRPSFSAKLCSRIQLNMTVAEVEGILRFPEGDYTTLPVFREPLGLSYSSWNGWHTWVSNEGAIHVRVNSAGRVTEVFFSGVHTLHQPFYDRLVTYISSWFP